MFNLIISSMIGFGFGGFCGHSLSQKGITAENALEKHQKTARGIFLGLVGILTLLIVLDRSNIYYKFPRLVPHLFLLYLQSSFDKVLLGFGFFICGLLLLLELSGWSSSKRRNQLLVGLSGITFCLCLLLYWFSPIVNDLGEFRTSDGVVLQSTTVTCAPASIATLARISGQYPNIQEKDVVKLTQTNRLGTNTISEIRAMKQLGLNPEYHHDFPLNKLLERHQLALLHVKQRWLSQQFPHAVALLGIDQENQELILGNPLFGVESKKINELEGYWFGEVIFVN
ncbi:papain-like cysteine protease family protein [Crocosphaera sp. XPORK-15E]|uniref:papain-like cysteine protease family protein n=1 Tax=Crocosphaera sp. XPORK-15E TaxID=3110247 RepID=UPI002B1F98CB|nr:papain-like cysteine protease family protein [Crocosphaera sp. XPORK-15E]MEA5533249.1 papain-like cysteine protease family protein [Crocosphaera sp. XPORK-15E]